MRSYITTSHACNANGHYIHDEYVVTKRIGE